MPPQTLSQLEREYEYAWDTLCVAYAHAIKAALEENRLDDAASLLILYERLCERALKTHTGVV